MLKILPAIHSKHPLRKTEIIQFFEKYGKEATESPIKRNVQLSFLETETQKAAVNCQHWLPGQSTKTSGTE